MIRKRQLLINALASVVQVVITGGSFLVLYRFVKDTVGIEQFGVWSVVLATTAASHIANLGLASGAIKFVSMYLARGRMDRVAQVVQTATLSLAVVLAVVLAALYPLFLHLIEATIAASAEAPEEIANVPVLITSARAILPYALASFWLSSAAAVFQAGLDGFQRIDLRSGLLSVTTLVYLGLSLWLVPQHGLVGLAQAQVLQAILLVLGAWFLLKRLLPTLPPVPFRWDLATFKEIFGYSFKFQIISTSQILFEPLAKILVMAFGGAAAAGYFEFAHRMVFQLRALIVTAHHAVVPTIADLQERAPALIQDIYKKSFRLLLYLILLLLPFCLAVTPLISDLWIGSYEPAFVLFANLLFVGWFMNMVANPAYFAYLGIGRLRWNVIGHLAIGGLNGALGASLGWFYGGVGVVAGFAAALIIGSLIIAIAYQREYHIAAADLVERETVLLGLASLAGLGLALVFYYQVRESWALLPLIGLVPGIYLLVVVLPLWNHPARRQLQQWLATLLPRAVPREPAER